MALLFWVIWAVREVLARGINQGVDWNSIYLNFSSIFGDFFLKFFEEEVSDYLS